MPNESSQTPQLELVLGDITALDVDAIVNAANSRLAGGGGVDGAIHRAAGPELQAYTDAHYDGCPTGECRISPGFRLRARHVIHCVGPVWHGGGAGEDDALAGCYRCAVALAEEHGLASLAFPAISTGIFGFPVDRAAAIAVRTVREAVAIGAVVRRVLFVCFDESTAQHYRHLLGES